MFMINGKTVVRLLWKTFGALGMAVVLGLMVLTQGVPHASAAAYTCLPNCPPTIVKYIHTNTPSNTTSYYTDLNNVYLNNNPQAKIIVMPNWTPFGDTEETGTTLSNIGVWYHNGKWSIFNEDHALMSYDAAFNIYAIIGSTSSFVQTATAANSAYNYTDIDNALTNNQPTARLFVTQNWNPNGSLSGQYDNHPLGVWYHNGKWSIFNQDGTPIPANASFNVVVQYGTTNNLFVHKATVVNADGSGSCLDASISVTEALFITPNWDQGPVYVPSTVVVAYHTHFHKWCIHTLNAASIPVGASFNVFF